MRKQSMKKVLDSSVDMNTKRESTSPINQTLNVTVNAKNYGMFGLAGKTNYSVQVEPSLAAK